MFGLKTGKDYDTLLMCYDQLKSQNIKLYEENERRRQWNIKMDEEVHNLKMNVYHLQEIIKELELDKQIENGVKRKIINKEVKEEKAMKGDFAREYWAYRRADPVNNKMSMKEYAEKIYQKSQVAVPIEEKNE